MAQLKRAVVACVFMTLLSGCQNVDHPELNPVKGRVLYLGEPVAEAVVAFHNDKSLRVATGRTDEQGEFYLSTFKDDDGAVAGEHVVTVTKTNVPTDDSQLSMDEAMSTSQVAVKPRQLMPARYASIDASPLRFTVTEDGPNEFTIELREGK